MFITVLDITQTTELSFIAKTLEQTPKGETLYVRYVLNNIICTRQYDTDRTVPDMMSSILKWMDRCQDDYEFNRVLNVDLKQLKKGA